jgi:hypothetical protein
MGRHIGTFGHEAHVAEVAMIHDLPIHPLFIDAIQLHGFGVINRVKQGGKGIAQAEATAATVTNVIDAIEFLE